MEIIQWILWIFASWIFFGLVFLNRKDAKEGKVIHIAIFIQLLLYLATLIIFVFLPWNKLHMLWVIPTCFIAGWIIGFSMIPIPIVGDLMRNICIILAHIFFIGTNWEIGGFPWEVSTMRAIRSRVKFEQYDSVEEFEKAIKEREDLLFGYELYYQGIKQLYEHDKDIMQKTNFHYSQMKERNKNAVIEAKHLLNEIRSRSKSINDLSYFTFPPIHGPGLDEMTKRATLLVEAYEKVFPDRPREKELTEHEHQILIHEVL